MRRIFMLVAVLVLAATAAYGQDKEKRAAVAFNGQITDASQFGYKSPSGAMSLDGSFKITERIEMLGHYVYDYSEKTFLDNGHSESVGAGLRFYLFDNVFAQAKVSLDSHENDTYTKRAFRTHIGGGIKAAGLTVVGSWLEPSKSIVVDPNTVRGLGLEAEYEQKVFEAGPVEVSSVTGGQFSTATFKQTGGPDSERFRGNIWGGQTGFRFRF